MAIIKERGGIIYIQWFDPLSKKVQAKSTHLPVNEANLKKAKKYAKELQDELTIKSKKLKRIGIQSSTLKDAL